MHIYFKTSSRIFLDKYKILAFIAGFFFFCRNLFPNFKHDIITELILQNLKEIIASYFSQRFYLEVLYEVVKWSVLPVSNVVHDRRRLEVTFV